MSNNQITLPDFVIANLYGNNLVVGNDVVAKERPKPIQIEKIEEPILNKPAANKIPTPSKQEPVASPSIQNTTTAIPANPIPAKTSTETPVPEITNTQTVKPEPGKPWYLGNNGKQITVMVKEDTVPYINDKHLQFLSNVLSACKLNLGDIALVNFKNYPLGFDELKKQTNPRIVLVFDISPKELKLPFTIPVYQVQDYAQCRFLFAPSLIKMEADNTESKAEKTKLWNSLKILFQL
jgi:hypothetical protein